MLPLGPRAALGLAQDGPKPEGAAAVRVLADGERKWATELRLSETALSARTRPGGFLESGRGAGEGERDSVKSCKD